MHIILRINGGKSEKISKKKNTYRLQKCPSSQGQSRA